MPCDRRSHAVRNAVAFGSALAALVAAVALGLRWQRCVQRTSGSDTDGRGAHARINVTAASEKEEAEAEGASAESGLVFGKRTAVRATATWTTWSARVGVAAGAVCAAALGGCIGAFVGGGVGRAVGIDVANVVEDRSMFGMWCIVSSPLILSLDLTNRAALDGVWPILTNAEALAVNAHWSGSPGRLLLSAGMPTPLGTTPRGFVRYAGQLGQVRGWQGVVGDDGSVSWQVGDCVDPWTEKACSRRYLDLRVEEGMTVDAAEAWCAAEPKCEGFTYITADEHTADGRVKVWFKDSSQIHFMDGTIFTKWGRGAIFSSRVKKSRAVPFVPSSPWPGAASGVQVWVKEYAATATAPPQAALLLVNVGDVTLDEFYIDSTTLPLVFAKGANVRDIWQRSALPPLAAGEGLRFADVAPHDSRFVMLVANAAALQ